MCKYDTNVKIHGLQLIDMIWVDHFSFVSLLHTSFHNKDHVIALYHAYQDPTIAHLMPEPSFEFAN
jgi:hypothetical protein